MPFIAWPKLNSALALGTAWTLWRVGSLLRMITGCPTCTPKTCGEYLQPFWSSTTGVFGAWNVRSPRPSLTYTNAFWRPLPGPTMRTSEVVGPSGMHRGSESMRTTRGFSAVPSYLMDPVIVLSPGRGGGGSGAAAGSGVAGAELGCGLGDPQATTKTSANRANPPRTRINIDLPRYQPVRRSLGEGGSTAMNLEQQSNHSPRP